VRLVVIACVVTAAACSAGAGPRAVAHPARGRPPRPALASASGWHVRVTRSDALPTAEASTGPLLDAPGDFPDRTLTALPRAGIVIYVTAFDDSAPARNLPPDIAMPYRLASFRHDRGWEGQPAPNVPEYVLFTRTGPYLLDVRVFFGSQDPSAAQLDRAQIELGTLSRGRALPN
jgi:hypothetical protein